MKYDPAKPLYQWQGFPPPGNMWIGGRCATVEVKLDSFAEEIERMRLRDMQRGSNLTYSGWIIIAVCITAHLMTSIRPIKRVAEYGFVLGLFAVLGGLFYKKTIENENFIIIGAVVIGGGLLMYKFNHWSVSHFPWKKTIPLVTGSARKKAGSFDQVQTELEKEKQDAR